MSKKVETEMIVERECKHSIRFKPTGEQFEAESKGSKPKTLTSIYICREAMAELACEKVKITIEAVE